VQLDYVIGLETKVVRAGSRRGEETQHILHKILGVRKTQIKLKSNSGHQIPTREVVILHCERKGNVCKVQFHVVEVKAPAVLSAQTRKEMGYTGQNTPTAGFSA